jgi:hypothetical protein
MKRLIKIFSWTTPPAITMLVMMMLMVTVSATAKVGDTFTQDKFKFTVLTENGDSGTVSVAKANEDIRGELNIPEVAVNNNIKYKVTNIENEGFYIFGNGYAFTKLVIPNSVTTIGMAAFSGCPGLTGELVIPNSVTTIGPRAFYDCRGFTGELVIPNSVTTIGEEAFWGCWGFTSLKVGAKEIRKRAFYDCRELSKLTIDNSVESIGMEAFSGCTGLTGELVIPNSVTTISEGAFQNCSGFTGELVIPNSVTTIGRGAFQNCTALKDVIFGASVKSIWYEAFSGCTGLKEEINIPSTVNNVYGEIFKGCNQIKQLNIGAKQISERAFYGMTGLKKVNFDKTVNIIESEAFSGCTGLMNIEIPNSVTLIGQRIVRRGRKNYKDALPVFDGCDKLSHICIPSNIKGRILLGKPKSGYYESISRDKLIYVKTKMKELTLPYNIYISLANNTKIDTTVIYHNVFAIGKLNNKISPYPCPDGHKYITGNLYVKPSVYNQYKNDSTYKSLNISDSIPVTFPEGQEYITLCRDFDVDLRHANDNLPLNVKPLKAYIVRDADMDNATAYLDELTYIPSRLKANVEGYKGVDEYVGVVLSGTPGHTYYVQMGEDDYSKGADGQMTVEKALAIVNQTSYDPNIYLSPSSEPKPYLVGAAGDMEVKPTETIDGVTYKNYGLKDGKFVEYEAEGVIPYNHAYLHVPVSSASGAKKSFTMEVRSSSPTTGISEVDASADSDSTQKAAYNLMGMRVGSGYHGIVIVDGKKFIRK